jgi:hypothetical protein
MMHPNIKSHCAMRNRVLIASRAVLGTPDLMVRSAGCEMESARRPGTPLEKAGQVDLMFPTTKGLGVVRISADCTLSDTLRQFVQLIGCGRSQWSIATSSQVAGGKNVQFCSRTLAVRLRRSYWSVRLRSRVSK